MKNFAFLFIASILFSCNDHFDVINAIHIDTLPQIYPDYTFVTIPSSIAPLNFQPQNSDVEAINAIFKCKKSQLVCSGKTSIDIDIDEWHNFLSENISDSINVEVSFLKESKWFTYKTFPIYISKDSIDYGLHYRLISPGYGIFSKMNIFERNLSNFDVDIIYPGTQLEAGCMNCHTSNHCNTAYSSTHYRGEHGATIIRRDNKYEAFNLKANPDDMPCVYTYWHPKGKHVAYSQNDTHQVFHMQNNKKISVFDSKSDITILDINKHQLISSPLIKTDYFETSPSFSPDGKILYYVTSEPCQMPEEYEKAKFVLCAISFDAATNTFGQSVDTLIDMRSSGKSIAWTHPSYDGKFLLFTVSDYGQFPIWNPEADLWIYNISTKEMHPLTLANSNASESFHNWSSNSRWIIFTSRRDDGYFSLPYIAHIDENGIAAKAFMLPQRNPSYYYDQELMSYNMPDFTISKTKYNSNYVESLLYKKDRITVSIK